MTINTCTITLEARGNVFESYFAEPQTGGPGVLLLHAWWGLKPFFKQACDRLAEQGFIAMAPDLMQGQIAQTIEEAQQLRKEENDPLAAAAAEAALNYLAHYPARRGNRLGVVGFSMGGNWSLYLAARHADIVGAVALFYGAGEADYSRMRARVIGHFSDVDEWEDYRYARSMIDAMQAAGLDATLHMYPGKAHWFVEEDRPEYDARAARLAWDRTFQFMRDSLHANMLA